MIKVFMYGVILTLSAVVTLWCLRHFPHIDLSGEGKRIAIVCGLALAFGFCLYDEGTI